MPQEEEKDIKRISIDLPIDLIEGVDRLRKEWGFRRRGQVFERLLQVILPKDSNEELYENQQLEFNHNSNHESTSNLNGIENIKNQTLTSKAIALIFLDSSVVNPKGKLSLSINNLMLINNITIPPIYPKAKPNPDDFPKFLFLEISFNKEL